jgi:hypothetical protein
MPDYVCRRLILFLDGTWNEDTEDHPATSIVYLRERLFWGLQVRLREKFPIDHEEFEKLNDFKKKGISGLVLDGFEYIVYYDRGVGTGPFLDALKGGIFGDGLDQKIREAYRFLSFWYRPGDEVFIFGFSRGAYTARSLAGYLQAVGLLRCEHCTTENEGRAWKYYRTNPVERLSGEWAWFQKPKGDPQVHDSRYMRVRALAVFDTVGALGVPAEGFRRINRSKYEFHDTDVNSLVDIALHAVAIDEPRRAFEPSIWTKPKFKLHDPQKSPVEQVWFAGAHADIGGGYVKWNQDDFGLSSMPLAWMLQRLKRLVMDTRPVAEEPDGFKPTVPPKRNVPIPFYDWDLLKAVNPVPAGMPPHGDGKFDIRTEFRDFAKADQHKPWAAASIVRRDAWRTINQLPIPKAKNVETAGRVAYADPIGESVHVSALERLFCKVVTDKGRVMNVFGNEADYAPANLLSAIPYLAASYLHDAISTPWRGIVEPIFSWKRFRIIDWNGESLDPSVAADAERAFALLPKPDRIGVTKMPDEMKLVLIPPAAPHAAPVALPPATPPPAKSP